MNFQKLLILLSLMIFTNSFVLAEISKEQYINWYKDISISEMERTGIPASIKLAQGILESRFGNSSLATDANNHFGIKCHDGWSGGRYYLKDDDRDKSGRLIKSCFRVYPHAEQSFYDHSEFLTTRSRYAGLFQLQRDDYKGWARGLKQAGYATNPQYANLLIKVVEDNKLYRFDSMSSQVIAEVVEEPVEMPQDKTRPVITNPQTKVPSTKPAEKPATNIPAYASYEMFPVKGNKSQFRINDAIVVPAENGETILMVANKEKIPVQRLIKYNDLTPHQDLIDGQYVFLQPKRKKYRGKRSSHKVRYGETMYTISQLYGIKLTQLYRLNQMDPNEKREPKVGARVSVKSKAQRPPALHPKGYVSPIQRRVNPGRVSPKVKNEISQNIDKQQNTNINKIESNKSVFSEPTREVKEERKYNAVTSSSPDHEKMVVNPVVKENKSVHEMKKDEPGSVEVKSESGTQKTSDPIERKPHVVYPRQTVSVEKKDSGEVDLTSEVHNSSPVQYQESETTTGIMYVVKKGDTLYNLSKRFNTTVEALKLKNDLSSNTISIGQSLIIE